MRAVPTAFLLASLVALSGLSVAARSGTAMTMPDPETTLIDLVALATKPRHVLFIGNSHTYTNGGIDLHVSRMAQGSMPPIDFDADSATLSGATLMEHWELDSQGRIPEGDYDVVVLQGHIPRNEGPRAASFLEYGRRFDEVAGRYGAETIFFMSGPHPDFPDINLGDIVKAHRKISAELDAKVAPVALATRKVRRQRPDLEMFTSDGVHASWAGTYLAAAVMYATLFERSPEGIDYAFGVSEEDAAYLQRAAWETVTQWNANDTETERGDA